MEIIAREVEENHRNMLSLKIKGERVCSWGAWPNTAKLGTQSHVIITNRLGNRSFGKIVGLNPNCSGLGKEWRGYTEIDRNVHLIFWI